MDQYEELSVIASGTYGTVIRCRHQNTNQIVAMKRFKHSDEMTLARNMAMSEIQTLQKIRHENVVTILDDFRHDRVVYLVLELLDCSLYDEMIQNNGGLGYDKCRDRIFQVMRGILYCHSIGIMHLDIKPDNVLVSSLGVVKLCDFGLSHTVSRIRFSTDYIGTRWYRAPELLVGDFTYGTAVDIWAIGCVFAEIMTGTPFLPGKDSLHQLKLIGLKLGQFCMRHRLLMVKDTNMGPIIKNLTGENKIAQIFSWWPETTVEFLNDCVNVDPAQRLPARKMIHHPYFTHDNFAQKFLPTLRTKVVAEFDQNPLMRPYKGQILLSTDFNDEDYFILPHHNLHGDPTL